MVNLNKKAKKGVEEEYTKNIHDSEDLGKIKDDPSLLKAREEAEEIEMARIVWVNLRKGLIGFFFLLLVVKEGIEIYFDEHIHIVLLGGGKENYGLLILLLWGLMTLFLVLLKGDRKKAMGTLVYGGVLSVVYIYVKGCFLSPYDNTGIIFKKAWIVISYIMDGDEVKKYMVNTVIPKMQVLLTTNVDYKTLPIEEIFDKFKNRLTYDGLTTKNMCENRGVEVLNDVLSEYTKKEVKVTGFFSDFFGGVGSFMYNHPIIMGVIGATLCVLYLGSGRVNYGDALNSFKTFSDNAYNFLGELMRRVRGVENKIEEQAVVIVKLNEIVLAQREQLMIVYGIVKECLAKLDTLEFFTGLSVEEREAVYKSIKTLWKGKGKD
jgi:hypothetical protein